MASRFEPDLVAIQDGLRSSSNSAASSPASSSSPPPLPDDVLRSFRFSQRKLGDSNGGATEARHRAAVRRVGQSVNTDDFNATASSNHENHKDSRDGSAYSRFSDRGLDVIAAKLEAMAEELERKRIRDEKIRKIETLRERCKTLGLDISQQDLEAWVNGSAASSSTNISQTTPNEDETQAPADEPQNVEPVPSSETQFAQDSETTLVEAGPARDSGSSAMRVDAQASLRSMRPLRGRKRAHSQMEAQDNTLSETDDDRDSDFVEANRQSPSPDRTESLRSEDGQDNAGRGNNSPMVSVNGAATRTAWSVLVAKYPEEIALTFRAGERPTSPLVTAMVSPCTPAFFTVQTPDLLT